MNKKQIRTCEDTFYYLDELLNKKENSKRTRSQRDVIDFRQLYRLNDILQKSNNIDISFFFLSVNSARASRKKVITYLRFICFSFLRESYSYPVIAFMLNLKDHTSVMYGVEQYKILCDYPDFMFKPFNDQFNRVRDELGY